MVLKRMMFATVVERLEPVLIGLVLVSISFCPSYLSYYFVSVLTLISMKLSMPSTMHLE